MNVRGWSHCLLALALAQVYARGKTNDKAVHHFDAGITDNPDNPLIVEDPVAGNGHSGSGGWVAYNAGSSGASAGESGGASRSAEVCDGIDDDGNGIIDDVDVQHDVSAIV
ncbi:MAG TPA: hypothetical protein VGI70_09255 [Polyangiales bacterium]|jgi:hypothetical protein